jgi:hypothetical protein
LHGYPVLGGEQKLLDLIEGGGVDAVVIGSRNLEANRLARIEEACREAGVELQRVSIRVETLVSSS